MARLADGIVLLIALTAPLAAAPPGERPVTDKQIVGDAVTQPLSDLNLKRKGIPAELLAIRERPYDLTGIQSCAEIIAEVQRLDVVLGEDVDRLEVDPAARKRREMAAGMTSGVIAGLIPFRALIREVSGARSAQQEFREAVYAGVVRRSFFKGMGEARGCKAPGRPLRPIEMAAEAANDLVGGQARTSLERAADQANAELNRSPQ